MSQHDSEVSVEWMRSVFPPISKAHKPDELRSQNIVDRVQGRAPIEPHLLRDWIIRISEITRTKPSQLAIKANLAASTVNRFLREVNSNVGLSVKTISSLEKAAKKIIREKFEGNEAGLFEKFLELGFDQKAFRLDELQSNVRLVEVLGQLPLNHFWAQETFQTFFDEKYSISIPVPVKYHNEPLCGFELSGFSENKSLLIREIAICTPTWIGKIDFRYNEKVIIVEKNEVQAVSVGIRELSKDDRGNIWLLPIHREIDTVEPSFLSRSTASIVKGSLGLAFVVIGSVQLMT